MEPYEMVGRFPSVQDFDAQNQRYKANQLAMMLQGNEVNNLPLSNQMLQYQVSSAGLANAQAQRKAQIMQMFADRLGGQGGAPAASAALGSGAAQGSVGPTVANGNRLAAMGAPQGGQGGGMLGIDPDTMFLGEIAGMMPEGAAKLWTENRFGRPMQPGYRQNLDGTTTFFVDPKDGRVVNPNTNEISLAPGAAASTAAMRAADTAGVNSQTMSPVDRLDAQGNPINKTVGQLVAGTGAPDPLNPAPTPGAPVAAPAGIPGVPSHNLAVATADAASQGRDLGTMTYNGQPAMAPGIQAMVDEAKKQGPEGVAKFAATMLPKILAVKDPAQRAQALQIFNADMQAPHGTPLTGATPAAPGSFMGPAAAAAQKLNAEQAVHAETDPVVALRKDLVTKSHEANQSFVNNLTDVVNNEGEIVGRNTRLQPLLDQLPKIGGFGQDQRTNFANNLKQAGLPDSIVNLVGSGDPTAAKTVDNQLSAAAIQTMLDTLNKEGKPNRVMYQALHEQQEGLAAGKPVLQNIMALQNQLYQQHLKQLGTATDLMAAPDYNPVKFSSQFATAKSQQIAAPPAAALTGAPAAQAAPVPAFDAAAIAAELKRRGH